LHWKQEKKISGSRYRKGELEVRCGLFIEKTYWNRQIKNAATNRGLKKAIRIYP